MDEEAAKPRDTTINQQQQYYYGTFQGVANYPPPAPPPLPHQPIVTSPLLPPVHGYQTLQEYTVVEVRPVREHDVPCCGFGMGWFLFIMGFLFGGIPWYLGAVIILFTSVDHREKAGYVACSVASVVYLIAVMLGMAGNINIIW
ncbi:60S ribosomal protein L18a-like protein isoform X2 [Brassica napus]|uniref:60S ribosomal protein L18a-like protein isoform X3 n=1 Tax=Brassica oleracea var. oleracea TaxID=109376 RepID=UPI0003C70771|nr:PREDICTED: 60S ribosomal protein L18a-like protein isoform X3 [Brassica oleracea var. oleracea]XP_022569562.1 60S ribosomal protein L18a-like protein isoform X2 [Brassica napus]